MREKLIPLALSASAVVGMNACSNDEETSIAEQAPVVSEATAELVTSTVLDIEEVQTTTSTTSTTTTLPETTSSTTTSTTTTTTEVTTTTSEPAPSWEDTHYLPESAYENGTRLGVLSVVNPDGERVINIPLFSFQDLEDSLAYEAQLDKGAVLEVAHPDINPNIINPDLAITETGLLGEDGIAVVPGHRVSPIKADWGNGNTIAQKVFDRMDEIDQGALATISFVDELAVGDLVYRYLGSFVVEDVMEYYSDSKKWKFQPDKLLQTRSGPQDQEILRLVACTPKGSVADRLLVDFVRVEED